MSVYLFSCGNCPAISRKIESESTGVTLKGMSIHLNRANDPTTGKAYTSFKVNISGKEPRELRNGYFYCSREGVIETLSSEAGEKVFGPHVCLGAKMTVSSQIKSSDSLDQVASGLLKKDVLSTPSGVKPSVAPAPALKETVSKDLEGSFQKLQVTPYTSVTLLPGSNVEEHVEKDTGIRTISIENPETGKAGTITVPKAKTSSGIEFNEHIKGNVFGGISLNYGCIDFSKLQNN